MVRASWSTKDVIDIQLDKTYTLQQDKTGRPLRA